MALSRRTACAASAILLAAAAVAWVIAPQKKSGRVIDALTGRVPVGVELTTDTLVLRRFAKGEFELPKALGAGEAMITAPGYSPVTIQLDQSSWPLNVALEPLDMPALAGIAAFPKQVGEDLLLDLRLLDGQARILGEFPGVPMAASLVVENAKGEDRGTIPLEVRRDNSGDTILLSGTVKVAAIGRAASPDGSAFRVVLVAAGRQVETRRLSLPPDAHPRAAQR